MWKIALISFLILSGLIHARPQSIQKLVINYVDYDIETPIRINLNDFYNSFSVELKEFIVNKKNDLVTFNKLFQELVPDSNNPKLDTRLIVEIHFTDKTVKYMGMDRFRIQIDQQIYKLSSELFDFIELLKREYKSDTHNSSNKSIPGIPGVIFSAKQTRTDAFSPFRNQEGTWTPSRDQITELESALPSGIASSSKRDLKSWRNEGGLKKILANLGDYKRQYLGFDKDGKQYIYVNAFCSDYAMGGKSWIHNFIKVFDGGSCFFQIVYDPVKKVFLRFNVNGYG
jgi:hypothetical protein